MSETGAFIHALADVQTDDIGPGSRVWQFCVVLAGARIGRDCNINAQCLIEGDVVLGDRVTVKSGVQLWTGLRVEDDVFIGPNVTFANDKYPRSRRPPPMFATTVLRRGASIGANATILCGVDIGAGAMIGAGSVVTRDVPAGELWVGNPARRRGMAPRLAECSAAEGGQ
ncbi:acyltransferase [uncultured Azohydromonas sp.]|jgi:Carbonic anhydrases/acetyltransferases, isoleucine patch superfamily|uniref:acyltransferase n=1 Tax=uncultured Azohydromonas sp. TaxID=487342 RepID=UPI0026111C65|nr:acyltransferase [uncultured Azohydromonas sp.]